MSNSVKKNFSYNLILTLCGYLFPFITYPYVSRVLGVQNIGICNFADSIINYFVLFSMLGVGSFGVREIARVKEDLERRSIVFTNLIFINLITTLFAIVVLSICIITVHKFQDYRSFLFVGVAKLLFNVFLIEWFYQGIQDFRYITIRSLIVRVLYVVSIFLFIKSPEDTFLYFVVTTSVTLFNASVNWYHSRQYIKIDRHSIDWRIYVIPIITFGYYRIITSMYTTFNTVFLGFVSNDTEVGYFATASKLYVIIMSVLTAFTTVMVPKVSELLYTKQHERLQWIANQTLSVVTIISLPFIIFCQFCAPQIIRILAGPGYEGAIIPFRIVICLLLVIGFEQILIQQFLMASIKNKPILIVCTIGAVTGVGLNFLLTPSLFSAGSSIAWGVSEIMVLLFGAIFVKRNIGVVVQKKEILTNFLLSLLYIVPLYYISQLNIDSIWINLLFSGVVTIMIFLVINLYLHKNQQIVNIIQTAKHVIKREK